MDMKLGGTFHPDQSNIDPDPKHWAHFIKHVAKDPVCRADGLSVLHPPAARVWRGQDSRVSPGVEIYEL